MSSIFEKLFDVKEKNGFNEGSIKKMEERLNIKLPRKFKEFYLNHGRNPIINSHNYFLTPENILIKNDKWLVFYMENQGICQWALNIMDFNQESCNVYINFEQNGYLQETKSFNDFLIIRALQYSHLLFPFRFWERKKMEVNELKLQKVFGKAKSDVKINGLFHQKIFWNNWKEAVIITFFPNGDSSVAVNSVLSESLLKFQGLFPNVMWKIERDRTSEKNKCTFSNQNTPIVIDDTINNSNLPF